MCQALKAAPTPPPEQAEEKGTRYQTLKGCTLMLIDYPEYYSKDIINKWRVSNTLHHISVDKLVIVL